MKIFIAACTGLGAWFVFGFILSAVWGMIPSIPGVSISQHVAQVLCCAACIGGAWVKLK